MTKKLVQLAEGIYWVGKSDHLGGLHCNPYLLVDGEDVILFDPGSVLDFEEVYRNITEIVPLQEINYAVVHHQDPDICSSIPLFEDKGAQFEIVTHWRTQTLIKYYGIKSRYHLVDEYNYKLRLKSGRELLFLPTPYLHFPGAIVTYDPKTKILFSSDLFGSFSEKWTLFADEDYLEKMITFHEHYMPSNEILRPVMELFLGMDISMIAPQHGSIIKDNPSRYIKTLRDLECGLFINPVKKNLSKSGGYSHIITLILKRLKSIFDSRELLKTIESLDITVNPETFELLDYNYTGQELWNKIFDTLYLSKGVLWITVIEPYVRKIALEYDLPIPQVFQSLLGEIEGRVHLLNTENNKLKEINQRLQTSIQETQEKLTRCSVTGLYNETFFKQYVHTEINRIFVSTLELSPFIIVINVDHVSKIRLSYGDTEVDQILKNIAYILESSNHSNDIYFRLEGASFSVYIPDSTPEKALSTAENIRKKIRESSSFIETITVSIGVAGLHEIIADLYSPEDMWEKLYQLALLRVSLAKSQGMDIVCNQSDAKEFAKKTGTILIVDNDRVNIDILRTYLENINYKVIHAVDGEEALFLAEKENPDLIISELMVPKVDGFLIREKLAMISSTKNIPYIIVSYIKDEDSVLRASTLNIEHYLRKPYMLTELLGIIKNKVRGEAV